MWFGVEELSGEKTHADDLTAEASLDMRYVGQSHESRVPLAADPVAAFHETHHSIYGLSGRASPVEVVTKKRDRSKRPRQRASTRSPARGREKPLWWRVGR